MRQTRIRSPAIAFAVLLVGGVPTAAQAEADNVKQFNIAAQSLDSALLAFSEQAQLQFVVEADLLEGVESPGFTGEGAAERVLLILLDDANLEFSAVGDTIAITSKSGGSGKGEPQGANDASSEPGDEQDEESESSAVQAPRIGNGNAQEEDDDEDGPLELSAHTVTGSRLAVDPSQISRRVIVLSAEELQNSGAVTLEQALRQLPQNIDGITEFGGSGLYRGSGDISPRLLGSANVHGASTINLRGLGDAATLVLLDGKRVSESGILGGFVDISEFPLSLVERVELQFDGGSSIYGSDAIGGVVNVVLKKGGDFRQVTLRRKMAPGFVENSASAIVGIPIAYGAGSVTFSFAAYQTPGQSLVRAVEDTGLSLFRPVTGATGHVQSTRSGREISPALTQAAVDAGLIAMDQQVLLVPLPEGQDGADLTIGDFLTDSINTYGDISDYAPPVSIVPASDRYVFGVSAQMEVSDRIEVHGRFRYSNRKTHHDSGDTWDNRRSVPYRVPADNPHNPFDRAVVVHRRPPDFGTKLVAGEREGLTLDLDIIGTIGNQWQWELRSRLSNRDGVASSSNIANRGRGGLVDSGLLDKGFNVFGNSLLTDGDNADILADARLVLPDQRTETNHRLLTSELVIKGSAFSLPAGKVSVAAGLEWRKSRINVNYGTTHLRFLNDNSPVDKMGLTRGFAIAGTKLLRAGFVELFVPVISKPNRFAGMHDFSITLSGRHETTAGSSNAGSLTHSRYNSNVWSTGLAWWPIESVKVHAHRSTSFRSPEIAQSLFPPIYNPVGFLLDLRGPFRQAFPSITSGGNPDLFPEEGTALNVGIDISPTFFEGLTISVDYHQTTYSNYISSVNTAGLFAVTKETFELFRFQFTTNENDEVVAFDARVANVAKRYIQGMDYSLQQVLEIGRNTFTLKASVAETQTFLQDVDAQHDLTELEQFIGSLLPKYGYKASLSWARGGWFVLLSTRRRSSLTYAWAQPLDEIGGVPKPVQATVKSSTPVDLSVTFDTGNRWGYLENMRVRFGVNNVLESFYETILDPEPAHGYLGRPRGVNSASGRSYYLALSKEF